MTDILFSGFYLGFLLVSFAALPVLNFSKKRMGGKVYIIVKRICVTFLIFALSQKYLSYYIICFSSYEFWYVLLLGLFSVSLLVLLVLKFSKKRTDKREYIIAKRICVIIFMLFLLFLSSHISEIISPCLCVCPVSSCSDCGFY